MLSDEGDFFSRSSRYASKSVSSSISLCDKVGSSSVNLEPAAAAPANPISPYRASSQRGGDTQICLNAILIQQLISSSVCWECFAGTDLPSFSEFFFRSGGVRRPSVHQILEDALSKGRRRKNFLNNGCLKFSIVSAAPSTRLITE